MGLQLYDMEQPTILCDYFITATVPTTFTKFKQNLIDTVAPNHHDIISAIIAKYSIR